MPRSSLLSLCAVLLILGGCTDGGPPLFPATGTVNFGGKGVDGAQVAFVSEDGPLATGTTDANGKFSLSTQGKPGAAAGEYKVTVTKQGSTGPLPVKPTPEDLMKMAKEKTMPKVEALLPLKYSTAQSTDLRATVTKDKSKNDFSLELKP